MKRLNVLEQVKGSKTYLGKSNMTSGNRYLITLKHNNEIVRFHFHDNYLNESTLKDHVYCLMLDAQTFEEHKNHLEFAKSFGYFDTNEAKRIYDQLNKQHTRYNKIFNEKEQKQLNALFENY